MKRVICVGNRYVDEDAAGPRVHDCLRGGDLPVDVEVIDGGLAGLDLLRFVDGAERVVFVDSVVEMGAAGAVMELEPRAVAALAPRAFGHGAGLGYLLRALPLGCEAPLPEVRVVGVQGPADQPTIERAARFSLSLALGGAR